MVKGQRQVNVTRLVHAPCVRFPCPNMSMERWVRNNDEIRPGLARFRRAYGQRSMDMWAEYEKLHPCFEVPQTVDLPRSFARGELDIIKVVHMAWFAKLAAWSGVRLYGNYIPLYYCLRDSFLCRHLNRFPEALGLLKAIKLS